MIGPGIMIRDTNCARVWAFSNDFFLDVALVMIESGPPAKILLEFGLYNFGPLLTNYLVSTLGLLRVLLLVSHWT